MYLAPRTAAGRALARATVRGYKNAYMGVLQGNPTGVLALTMLVAFMLLLVAALQLRAMLPLIFDGTGSKFINSQLANGGRASLLMLVATSWGLSLFIETLGLQSPGIMRVAATRPLGIVNRAIGQLLPPVIASILASLILAGQTPFALISHLLRTHSTIPPLVAAGLSLAVLISATCASACMALTLPSLVAMLIGRTRGTAEVRMVSGSIISGFLLVGFAPVLSGNTIGLYLLAPPLILTRGIPSNAFEVMVAVAGAALWLAGCSLLVGLRPTGSPNRGGAHLKLPWLRLPNLIATFELRQGLRDTMFLSSAAISVSGSAAVAVLFWRQVIPLESARLYLVLLIGLMSTATSVLAFRAASLGWFQMTRVNAYLRWYTGALSGAGAASLIVVFLCRIASGLPFSWEADFFLTGIAICGSVLGVVCGVVVTRPGISTESQSGLYAGNFLAAIALTVVFLVTKYFAIFSHVVAAVGVLLIISVAAALAGLLLVQHRVRTWGHTPADA